MSLNMVYFEELREKINSKLKELSRDGKIDKEKAKKQTEDYPWLYGALGKVPSAVMFICENPSLAGIESANVNTIDGGRPDIEAQWWGGNAKRFRDALCKLQLKTNRRGMRGGWECYITNVIKHADIANLQEKKSINTKREQAKEWSEILRWELGHVKPNYVFCVGGNSFTCVQTLQMDGELDEFPIYPVRHYSDRGKTEEIIESIVSAVQNVIVNK